MVKLGVITDGISRDFERALQVMTEAGLMHAELQFLWDKEVGDLTPQEMDKAQDLIKRYQVTVSCISRHNFSGMLVGAVEPEDAVYTQHMDGFKRCIEMAHRFGTRLVRIMSFRRG